MRPTHFQLVTGNRPDTRVEVELLPFRPAQLAGPNENMRKKPECNPRQDIAVVLFDSSQQSTGFRGVGNRRAMSRARRNQRPAQIGADVRSDLAVAMA